MLKITLLSALLIAVLSGCGATSPPATLISGQMEVVTIGAGIPETKEYILHIPAGVKFPLRLYVHGSLMEEETDPIQEISIKRDIYLYRQWTSFDGIQWMGPEETDRFINYRVNVNLDGSGGEVNVLAEEE